VARWAWRRATAFADILLFSVVYLQAEVDMTTITITLPDERLRELKETASQLKVSPEELVRVSIEELLTRPAEAFQRTVDYVLKKNAELYERLA
jgi:low affinity Fe/Cu permease